MPLIVFFPVLLLCLLAIYIRVAPQSIEKLHKTLAASEDTVLKGGVIKRASVDFNALHSVIMAEPRTTCVAGTPSEGRVTYVTRSLLWGFPDYTTVQQDQNGVQIYGRLVFGRSDFGVNAARVDRWINTLTTNQSTSV